jgi:molybdopterin-guanine dinucleotide biosynthesis protein MobB
MEFVTRGLTRLGFQVAVAKHIHAEGFTIDTEGKDTWRHARAGAKVVIGVSPSEMAVIKKTSSETEFGQVIQEFDGLDLDVALLEGFSSASRRWQGIPKIVVAKSRSDLARTLSRTTPPIIAISGPVVDGASKNRTARLPMVNVMKDGPILTSMIRRLLKPNEMSETLRNAAVKHGDACIGLAIGVRAAHLASSAFGLDGPSLKAIECGARQCVADGIKSTYAKPSITVRDERTDLIAFQSPIAQLSLKLIPKHKTRFTRASQVLNVPDARIFESVELS